MTTVTDEALDWFLDRSVGSTDGPMDTIAVGTGTDSESQDATGLSEPVYTGSVDDNNVELLQVEGEIGLLEAIITLKGGTEVPGGTEISEIMVTSELDDVVIAIDNFDGIEVESGHTEEFTMPIQVDR